MFCGLNQEGTSRCKLSRRSKAGKDSIFTQGRPLKVVGSFRVNVMGDAELPPGCLAKASEPNNLLARFPGGMPYSHHSHSGEFCKHAVGTLEEVVVEAIRRGFRVFGLSEHVPRYRTSDLYPEEVGEADRPPACSAITTSQNGLTPEELMKQFERYIDEAHRLRLAYHDDITLLVGLETEYITSVDLDSLEKLLGRFGEKIEYLVGSVHHVHGVPIDFDLSTFQRCLEGFHAETEHDRMEEFLCAYFDAQYVVLERFRPEIVGHIDLCRLYNPQLLFSDYSKAEEKLERNIQFAVDYGALFEASAAPFRKGWSTGYPGKDALEVGPSVKGADVGCF